MPLALAQIHSFIRNLNICERQNHKNQNEEKKTPSNHRHSFAKNIVFSTVQAAAQFQPQD